MSGCREIGRGTELADGSIRNEATLLEYSIIARAAPLHGRAVALVVDADHEFRRFALRLLRRIDVAPLGFVSGEDAVRWLDQNRTPSLVMMDAVLPGISGFTLCERVRRMPATSDVPILMLSARRDNQDDLRALATGADAFLEKPVTGTECMIAAGALLRDHARDNRR